MSEFRSRIMVKAELEIDLTRLTMRLENKQVKVFDVPKMLMIPEEPARLIMAARRAAGLSSFWGAQHARAKHEVAEAEDHLKIVLGEYNIKVRSVLDKMLKQKQAEGPALDDNFNPDEPDASPALDPKQFGVVSSAVEIQPNVLDARRVLRLKTYFQDTLKTVASAAAQRAWLINRLLGVKAEPDFITE